MTETRTFLTVLFTKTIIVPKANILFNINEKKKKKIKKIPFKILEFIVILKCTHTIQTITS